MRYTLAAFSGTISSEIRYALQYLYLSRTKKTIHIYRYIGLKILRSMIFLFVPFLWTTSPDLSLVCSSHDFEFAYYLWQLPSQRHTKHVEHIIFCIVSMPCILLPLFLTSLHIILDMTYQACRSCSILHSFYALHTLNLYFAAWHFRS